MSLMEIRSRWTRLVKDGGAEGERVVVAATFTADPIAAYLGMALIDEGADVPRVEMAPFNQLFQLCYDWRGMFPGDTPSAIVLLWRIEDFLRGELQGFLRGDEEALARAKTRIAELSDAIAHLRREFPGAIVVSTPPFPHSGDQHIRAARGVFEAGCFHRVASDEWLARIAAMGDLSVLDMDGVQRLLGIERAHDDRKWYLYRQPFTEAFWNELGRDCAQVLSRRRVAPKKCLVLDCDNTLWGGVIGEDGLMGIALGEDFPGSAFRDVQHQALNLRSQGVMLALCSKNNEADVWEVFDKHDGMVLKREHIVAHRINWLDKPTNIIALAKEMNVGLDSLVFLDDSPMEIGHVREALPMVACVTVPADVAAYPAALSAVRLFDRERISEEDRTRSDMMLQERDRKALVATLGAEEFRAALGLVVDIFEAAPEHVARVAQLVNKTNQFNLTTRRKTAAEIGELAGGGCSHVLAVKVADRFGDYGLVGVLILTRSGETLEIETFLMSCRVLGRGVEEAIFAALADFARDRAATRLRGEYVATPKNAMVADLYASHGFRENGGGAWETCGLETFAWPSHIERRGL